MNKFRQRFNRFCYKNRSKGIPNLMLYITLGAAVLAAMLSGISFEQLDMCEVCEVSDYLRVLREQVDMAETIVKYKGMRFPTSKK